jgi:hypothetical protein
MSDRTGLCPNEWANLIKRVSQAHEIRPQDGKIEQCADVSETADNLSAGSMVRWVHTIFQRPLQV